MIWENRRIYELYTEENNELKSAYSKIGIKTHRPRVSMLQLLKPKHIVEHYNKIAGSRGGILQRGIFR